MRTSILLAVRCSALSMLFPMLTGLGTLFPPADAAQVHWMGGPSKGYEIAVVWSTGKVPTVGDTACFDINGNYNPYLVNLTSNQACDSLVVSNSNLATLYSAGGPTVCALQLQTGAASLTVGSGGTLNIGRDTQVATLQVLVDHEVKVYPASQLNLTVGAYVAADSVRNGGILAVQYNASLKASSILENSSVTNLVNGTIIGPATFLNSFGGTLNAQGLINTGLENYGQVNLTGPLQLTGTSSNLGSIAVPSKQVLRNDGELTNSGTISLTSGGITGAGAAAWFAQPE